MTPREAFKLGFLQKCAADGLSREETLERIRHARLALMAPPAEKAAAVEDYVPGVEAIKSLLGKAFWPAMLAPPLLGIGAGALASDATSSNYDPAEAKKREELAEYQRALKAMQQVHARQHP